MKNNIEKVRTVKGWATLGGKMAVVTYKSGTVRTYQHIDIYGLPASVKGFMQAARESGTVTTNEYGSTTYTL